MTSQTPEEAEGSSLRPWWPGVPWTTVRASIAGRIAIDTRTLALFRMALGLLGLVDLILRAERFSFFYTEDGVVPVAIAREAAPDNALSIYFLTTDPTVIAALWVLQGLFAVMLLVGYQARLAAIVSFVLVVSLDHRNMLLTSGADTLFRLLMFWAIFLPLGERWSIDAIHRVRPPRERIASLATVAILLQVLYVYLVNARRKWEGGMWLDGEAVIVIFGLDEFTAYLGHWLRDFPMLLQAGGVAWFIALNLSPLLLLTAGRWRNATTCVFLGGHAMFAFTMRIGAFPYVSMAGVLLFFQSKAWEDAERLLRMVRCDGYVAHLAEGVAVAGRRAAAVLPRIEVTGAVPRLIGGRVLHYTLLVGVLSVLVLPGIRELWGAGLFPVNGGHIASGNYEVSGMLGIRQSRWALFAPTPRHVDFWYVFAARTTEGELLDVYHDRPLSFERPYRVLHKQYPTYRERYYMDDVRKGRADGAVPRRLAEYLCEQWLAERGIELTHINFYAFREEVTAETVDSPEGRERTVTVTYRHGCGDNDPMDLPGPPTDDVPEDEEHEDATGTADRFEDGVLRRSAARIPAGAGRRR